MLGILIVAIAMVGVGCTPPPGRTILAVAYMNVDGLACYDEATDVLIAKLVDTNTDGVVSVGDTVVTHQYPLDFDASSFGTFQTTSHQVTVAQVAEPTFVRVNIGTDWQMEWVITPEVVQWDETGDANTLLDGHLAGWGNVIQVRPDSPSAPDAYLQVSGPGADNDESFLDIDISI